MTIALICFLDFYFFILSEDLLGAFDKTTEIANTNMYS